MNNWMISDTHFICAILHWHALQTGVSGSEVSGIFKTDKMAKKKKERHTGQQSVTKSG